MKIKFAVFYYAPCNTQLDFPTFIFGPFKTYEVADQYGKDLQTDGSYAIETMVKP